MPLVLTLDHITAVEAHTAAATLSSADGITIMTTDGTISTATASAFITFMVADFTVVGTGRDELPSEKKKNLTQRRKGAKVRTMRE
ncbi:MAG: hypothetical protein JOZ31_03865 [Verrucomicrobia bacterium]|nr:hypothetical protein [Verrucomicrobiota bacterium]MBV8483515.1 hypothetical protein [Verrucomicrobiota bacterium]